jgi:colanic acid biosynthesis glycosyl transferase WcaI
LEQLVSGLRNVTLLPLQPLHKLNDLLNAADIHLLPQRAGAADLVMPSKLTGMLASGRPVIATASKGTQLANVVEQCGIVVPAAEPTDELDGLYAAVRKLVANPELRRTLGIAAREYAEQNMGRDNVLGNFALEIEMKMQRRA